MIKLIHKNIKAKINDAELLKDLIQDSYLSILVKYHGNSNTNLLNSIVKNKFLNIKRYYKTLKNRDDYLRYSWFLDKNDACLDSHIEQIELKKWLNNNVEKLPDKQKKILKLVIYEEMNFSEISKALNIPYNTVKANYRHAINRLRVLCGS